MHGHLGTPLIFFTKTLCYSTGQWLKILLYCLREINNLICATHYVKKVQFSSFPVNVYLNLQGTTAQFDSGQWQCTVSATHYQVGHCGSHQVDHHAGH